MHYKPKEFMIPAIPGISNKTIELHMGLYKGYVTHVNHLHEQLTKIAATDAGEMNYAIQELRRRLGFEWNGMRLHELYFEALTPKPAALMGETALYKKLVEQYGGYSEWLDIFTKLSARGPGWALLCYDPEADALINTWVADHELGTLSGIPVILALDHWEHAYLLDYAPAEKNSYVESYLKALNWDIVNKRLEDVQHSE
jgi:superoxide dismutase, Fe-Mn family